MKKKKHVFRQNKAEKIMLGKIFSIMQELEWNVGTPKRNKESNTELEVETWSPAGENIVDYLIFDGTPDDLLRELKERYDSFDVDDHVAMWVEARQSRSGIPNIRTLVDDADAIEDMYLKLYESVEKLLNANNIYA